jgi:hypothetical protein
VTGAITASNDITSSGGAIRGGTITTDTTGASGTYVTAIGGTITAGSHMYPSDMRLKENIVPVTGSLEKIERLTGVNFSFKNQPGEKRLGLLAQNVEAVVPEIVRTQADGMKSVDYAPLTALLIEGMKEQQQEINTLREELGRVKEAVVSEK